MLGEQDFADGAIVATDAAWLSAQANESGPSLGLYSSPGFITWFHDALDPGLPGILTFSLWNLDSREPGNQVTDFRLDNVPQSISGFETVEPDLSVKIFQFPVAANLLADGQVQVFIMLGPPSNLVGVDFSRLESVPEPSGLALLTIPVLLGLQLMRRRSAARNSDPPFGRYRSIC
jgi:hypothetical protein